MFKASVTSKLSALGNTFIHKVWKRSKYKGRDIFNSDSREAERGSRGIMLDLPFPPCVSLTVHTAAQRASQQDRQDRH